MDDFEKNFLSKLQLKISHLLPNINDVFDTVGLVPYNFSKSNVFPKNKGNKVSLKKRDNNQKKRLASLLIITYLLALAYMYSRSLYSNSNRK